MSKRALSPVVFATTGGAGPSASKIITRLAVRLSHKTSEPYADVVGFIRTKVDPSGKSGKVGLEVGDVIEAVNGEICSNRREAVDFIQTSSTVLHLMIRRYNNRASLVQQCLSNARNKANNSTNIFYPQKRHLRLSKSAGDLHNIKDERQINNSDSAIASENKSIAADEFCLNSDIRSNFEEPESAYFVKHGRSYSSFEPSRKASSRKYVRASKPPRSEPAFDVYPVPRRHSMGYSLEVIPDSKEYHGNSILPTCTVLNAEGHHKISVSVSEDFLKRHSIATEGTFDNSNLENDDTNDFRGKTGSLFAERSKVDALFMASAKDLKDSYGKTMDCSSAAPPPVTSSGAGVPPLPPARNSSMFAVHEIAQHRGVWSRNTKAVAQVDSKSTLNNVNGVSTSASTNEQPGQIFVASIKQSSDHSGISIPSMEQDVPKTTAESVSNQLSESSAKLMLTSRGCDNKSGLKTTSQANSSDFISTKSFPNQSQFVSRPHSSADLIDEDQIFAHQPFHLMDRPHTSTDMYSNVLTSKTDGKPEIACMGETGLNVASHESLGDFAARSSSYTPDRVLNDKFRPDLRSTDSLQGYARSGSEEKHEFDSRQKEKPSSNKWGVSFEGLSPENNVFIESSDKRKSRTDLETDSAVGSGSSVDGTYPKLQSGRLLMNGASSKTYQSSTAISNQLNESSAHTVNSSSSMPLQTQPPPVPARDSSKGINFADYKRFPGTNSSSNPGVPVAVARKCVILDPMSMKQFSPAKETGLNSSNSSYSPFHKPLPETPPSKNILERRSSKELDSSNFDGAKPSPIVTNTRSATFDMSYLTSNTSQQPNRRSTYLSNQSSKAIPPESMDTRVHKGVNYTSNVSKTTLSSMDQKPQQPFNIPFSWERSSSSGIQTDASFESPDKSGLLLDPDDSPPVIPPRQPFLSSTPLPDQTDGLRDQSSNYLKNELESRSQWVPEKARKISSQTPNTKVGHKTSASMISDIGSKVTQPRFLSDPSSEARASPANRRRDHVRPGKISDPQSSLDYRKSGFPVTSSPQDTLASFEPVSVLSEESCPPSRLSQDFETDSQTDVTSPVSVIAFAQKKILVSDAELTDKESCPDGTSSYKFEENVQSELSSFDEAKIYPAESRENYEMPATSRLSDANRYQDKHALSSQKLAGKSVLDNFERPISGQPDLLYTHRKTSSLLAPANRGGVFGQRQSLAYSTENSQQRVSRVPVTNNLENTVNASADNFRRKTAILPRETSIDSALSLEAQTNLAGFSSKMMLAETHNDRSSLEKEFILSNDGNEDDTFDAIDPKVRDRILSQRRMSGPENLVTSRNQRESLRQEFVKNERTRSQSDVLDEEDGVTSSFKTKETSENVSDAPPTGSISTEKRSFISNPAFKTRVTGESTEEYVDDADEHLAGSSQSQFRIAKNRFLRKTDESRASSRNSTRPIMPSKRTSSIRLRIARSTENISNTTTNSSPSSVNLDSRANNRAFSSVEERSLKSGDADLGHATANKPTTIHRKLSKSTANISDLTTSSNSDVTQDSGLGLGTSAAKGTRDEMTSPLAVKSCLNESKNSLFSNSRTMSSDDLSASAVTGASDGGFLSRSGSLDNLLADFDGDQVTNALHKVQDMLEKERLELKDLVSNLLEENKSECEQIAAAIQQNGRETDVKRFNRHLESLCTSCKLAVHEESRLTKLDSRIHELANRSATDNSCSHDSAAATAQRSQKSIDREMEHIRRTWEKQKVKVAEAKSAFEDAESTLLQHLEKVLKNAPEDLQTSRSKIESRIELTRKICLSESSIKSNQEIEKFLKKQLVTSNNS